ncbi:MAG: ribosome hibernation-promoting factor, HPF/YfiA family [Anaerolineales bacterium]
MDVQIYNRNLELTDRLSDYVHSKVEKFERYLPSVEGIRVDLAETNIRNASRRMVAQLTIHVPGTILRAEERGADIFAAFDVVLDKMERQIQRYKGRKRRRRMTAAPAGEELAAAAEVAAEDLGGEIVRTKRFEVSSMLPEDATDQMELLGHFFYVFLDATDGMLSVVYKREDGEYGLLKPIY